MKIRWASVSFGIACLAVCGTWLTALAAEGPAVYRPEVGTYHPDFVLPRIDNNEPLRLSDYRGRKVLLIHFASW